MHTSIISTNVSPTITPNDIHIATNANVSIFGFNVPTPDNQHNLILECDSMICRILDRAKEIFGTFLPPILTTVVHGEAKIQMIYTINKNNMDESTCTSLHNVKDVVSSVRCGEESGIVLSKEFDYQKNLIIKSMTFYNFTQWK